ncbi:MAG TPA: replication-relaxation family protein [Dehalococcoidia bacterium]|nr:replication-relaxation family protein [Dehalococcoidia bacterium]
MIDADLETQWAVLDWVARLPLLGAYEVSMLLGVGEREASSLLSELQRCGWLDSVQESSPELDLGRLYALSPDGARGLPAAFGLSVQELNASFPTGELEVPQRRARIEITAGVNRLAAEIVAACQREGDLELKDIRALPSRRHSSAWRPTDAEAFGCLNSGSAFAPFFVVWDRAGASQFHRKQRVLAWAAFRDGDQPWGYRGMPSILVLCASQAEASQWEQGVLASADRRQGQPLPVLLAEIEAMWSADPLEAIWRRPGSSQESPLTDLLTWRRTMPPEVTCPQFELPYRPLEASAVRAEGSGSQSSPRFAPPSIGASEKQLLRWLGPHPLLTGGELKVLLRTRGHDADHLAVGLVRKGLVDCVAGQADGETSVEPRYFLTAEGLRLLAQQDGVPPRRYVRNGPVAAAVPGWKGAGRLDTLLRQFEHTVGVNGFVVRLIDDGRRCGLVIANWLSASEGAQRFTRGGATHWLRPDAVLRLSCNDNLHRVYVEWDRGTMRLPEMAEKFRIYAAYYVSLSLGRIRLAQRHSSSS